MSIFNNLKINNSNNVNVPDSNNAHTCKASIETRTWYMYVVDPVAVIHIASTEQTVVTVGQLNIQGTSHINKVLES